jgi:hypothetical protein
MGKIGIFLRANKIAVYGAIIWLFLWFVPWGDALSFEGNLFLIYFVDVLKLLVALVMFVLPGALLYMLLWEEGNPLFHEPLGVLPIGFALSVAIIGLIGVAGRLLGFSFELVKNLFMVLGFGEWLALTWRQKDFAAEIRQFKTVLRDVLGNIPLMLSLFVTALMTFNDYLFFVDDLTYLAYLTNWQNSSHLHFNNIIHQVDVLEIERFWLALYPMGQAFLADLSGVPGILLFSNYLEFFLLLMAVITSYWFGRTLGLSTRAAGFSTLIQISLYTWMIGEQWPVGFWFFFNLAEDKVTSVFLLAPVFFFFVLNFVSRFSRKNFALAFLSGMSLTLTHPVILFFACIIALQMGVFALVLKKTRWREFVALAAIVLILVSPYALIRYYNYSASSGFSANAANLGASYQVERYTKVVSNIFYGLNPEVLLFFDLPPEIQFRNSFQVVRVFPFVLASLAGIIALSKLRKGPLEWYVSACVVLIALAAIPYTGWILGFFADARLISRASWFSPLGLAGALVLRPVADRWAKSSFAAKMEKNYASKFKNGNFWGLMLCILFISPMLLGGFLPHFPNYFEALDYNRQIANVGTYIDQNSSAPVTVIALNYGDIQMLPGVSANTSIISYREEKDDNGHNFFMSPDEIHHRMYASNTIRSLDATISCAERKSLMDEFDVRYVIAHAKDAESFTEIIDRCEIHIKPVYQTRDFVVLKVR